MLVGVSLTLDKIYGVPRPRTFFNLNNALQWLGLIFFINSIPKLSLLGLPKQSYAQTLIQFPTL